MKNGSQSYLNKSYLWLLVYITAIFPYFFTATYVIYFLYSDPDPPQLPPSISQAIVDCSAIHVDDILVTGSRISFNLTIDDFVQYPKSAAIQLIQTSIKTGNTMSMYAYNNFWDVTSNLTNVFFNVLHPFSSPKTIIDIQCGNFLLSRAITSIKEIPYYPVGWTRISSDDLSYANLYDCCFINERFYISTTSTSVNLSPMQFSPDNTIPVSSTKYRAADFASFHSLVLENPKQNDLTYDAIFVTLTQKMMHNEVIDLLIPLWAHLVITKNARNKTVVLAKNQEQFKETIKLIFDGEIVNARDKNMCFHYGSVLHDTFGKYYNVDPADFSAHVIEDWSFHAQFYSRLMSLQKETILTLKTRIFSQFAHEKTKNDDKEPKKQIVLDEKLSDLAKRIKKLYPNVKVHVIEEYKSVKQIAKIMKYADFFLATDIFSMAYSIFMNEASYLVEFAPIGTECLKLGQQWAEIANVKYMNLVRNNKCLVSRFDEYFRDLKQYQLPTLSDNDIKNLFDQLFKLKE